MVSVCLGIVVFGFVLLFGFCLVLVVCGWEGFRVGSEGLVLRFLWGLGVFGWGSCDLVVLVCFRKV